MPPEKKISKLEIPKQARCNDRPRNNLLAELESFYGSLDYRTHGGFGDKRIVNIGDYYRPMSGNRSDLLQSSSNQESLTPGNDSHGLRQRFTEMYDQLKAHGKTLTDVGQTLTSTAQKVDELKNWQIGKIDNAESAITGLEVHLEKLNDTEKSLSDAKDKLASVKSVITENSDVLLLKTKNTDDNVVKDIFSRNLDHIGLRDLEADLQKIVSQAQAETYIGEIKPLINMAEGTLQDVKKYHQEVIKWQTQLKANREILTNVEQTLTSTAKKVNELKNWKFDTVENTTIDLAGHLEKLNDTEKSLSDAKDKLSPLKSLTKEDYDALHEEIKETKNQDVMTLFTQLVDDISTISQQSDQKNSALKAKVTSQLEKIEKSRMEAESHLPPILGEIRNYYRCLSRQAQVGSHEHFSQQYSMISDVAQQAFDAVYKKADIDRENLNKDYMAIIEAEETLDKVAADVPSLISWITPTYTDRRAFEEKIWSDNHLEAQPRPTGESIYDQIYTQKIIKNTLDGKLKALDQNMDIITEKNNELSYMSRGSVRLYYQALRPEIETIQYHRTTSYFLREVSKTYTMYQRFEEEREIVLKYAEKFMKKINQVPVEKRKGELAEVTKEYNRLLEKLPEHPFFKRGKMNYDTRSYTYAYTRFIPEGTFFGAQTADLLRAILKTQNDGGYKITAEEVAQRLQLHPYDGRIGADLERVFSDLGGKNGYKSGMMPLSSERLETVLEKWPIIVTLDNADIAPPEERLRQHVILDRFKKGSLFKKPSVVIVDGLTVPYKISLNELALVWTGEVFAPAEDLQ